MGAAISDPVTPIWPEFASNNSIRGPQGTFRTANHPDMSLGSASHNRKLLVIVSTRSTGATGNVANINISGVLYTSNSFQYSNTTSMPRCTAMMIDHPGGTTSNIVVGYSANAGAVDTTCVVWNLKNVRNGLVIMDANSSSSNNVGTNIECDPGGIVISYGEVLWNSTIVCQCDHSSVINSSQGFDSGGSSAAVHVSSACRDNRQAFDNSSPYWHRTFATGIKWIKISGSATAITNIGNFYFGIR